MNLFDDLHVAYADKSNKDLNRAYLLFSLIKSPFLTKLLTKIVKFSIRIGLPIQYIIKATVYRQFCGGTTIHDSKQVVAKLWKSKIGTILDFSAEGKDTTKDFERAKNEILQTILKSKQEESIPFAVFKPTAVASPILLEKISHKETLSAVELQEKQEAYNRIQEICQSAFDHQVPLFVDAEESWLQDPIDEIVLSMMRKFNLQKAWIFNTLQMYRTDRLAYLEEIHAIAKEEGFFIGIKLVRGAYHAQEMERSEKLQLPCPVHIVKQNTDNDYNLAQKFCVEHLDRIAFCSGTHNEESAAYLTALIQQHNIDKNDKRIIFSQLLGMSDHISYNLAKNGFNIAKYVPYGPVKDVIPYLIRRAEENTSIAGQMGRELSNIIKEQERRKREKTS